MSTQEAVRSGKDEEAENDQPIDLEALAKDAEAGKLRVHIPLSWDNTEREAAYATALAELENDPGLVRLRAMQRQFTEFLGQQHAKEEEKLRLVREALANRPPSGLAKAGQSIINGFGLLARFILALVTVPCAAFANVAVDTWEFATTKLLPILVTSIVGAFGVVVVFGGLAKFASFILTLSFAGYATMVIVAFLSLGYVISTFMAMTTTLSKAFGPRWGNKRFLD